MFQSATNRSKPQRALWRLLAFIVTVVGMIGVTAGSASAVTTTTPNSSSGRTASVGTETRVGVTTHFSGGSSARLATVRAGCVGENITGYGGFVLVSCVATKPGEYVDLTDAQGKTHILDGEVRPDGSYSGGHRPGTGYPGKSEFPKGWSDERILHEISDVATDPAAVRTLQGPNTQIVTGTRGGVEIKVVVRNGRIVTGYPTNTPRNP